MDIFNASHLRGNIVAWLPIKKNDRVCYIGTEDDAAAQKLRQMSDHLICCGRKTEPDESEETYDYIIRLSCASEEEIQNDYAKLSKRGILALAAENAYGLKYLAGAKEIGSGAYFGGVESVENSVGTTREELAAVLKKAGFAWQKFYYPFPDHQFAMSVYSDEYLPKQGELIDQIGNFDAERMILFDETKAADALIARDQFRNFSNAFFVAAGKSGAQTFADEKNETISYVKFSNDRGIDHNIRTYITRDADGRFHLRKIADSPKAGRHIANLSKTAEKLKELYADSRFTINSCTECDEGAEFAFLQGRTMEEELDRYLEQGEYETAFARILETLDEIRLDQKGIPFQMTEEFQRVFGAQTLPEGMLALPVSDIDLIMSNILVSRDQSWNVIDYEWSFHFPIPVNFILYRNIRYYADTTAARRTLRPDRLYEQAGITRQELSVYDAMEEAFQSYVLGGHIPMRQLYKEAGKPAYHISSVLHVVDDLERRRALQIYFDRGAGFGEGDVKTFHSKALDGTYHLEIPIEDDVVKLRIDPGSQACTVDIGCLTFAGSQKRILDFICNGHKMAGDMYLFDTDDPNILLEQLPPKNRILRLDFRIDSMSLAAAEWIAPKIDAKYRLKKMLKK